MKDATGREIKEGDYVITTADRCDFSYGRVYEATPTMVRMFAGLGWDKTTPRVYKKMSRHKVMVVEDPSIIAYILEKDPEMENMNTYDLK